MIAINNTNSFENGYTVFIKKQFAQCFQQLTILVRSWSRFIQQPNWFPLSPKDGCLCQSWSTNSPFLIWRHGRSSCLKHYTKKIIQLEGNTFNKAKMEGAQTQVLILTQNLHWYSSFVRSGKNFGEEEHEALCALLNASLCLLVKVYRRKVPILLSPTLWSP